MGNIGFLGILDRLSIAHQLGLQIDTMGRGYDAAKDLITLPIDDADECLRATYLMICLKIGPDVCQTADGRNRSR